MPDPAFLIDGHMEQLILRRLGCDVPVQRLSANGEDVVIEAIAARVGALYEVLGNRYFPVCVIFDREGRDRPAETLESDLLAALAKRGYPIDQFIVCCCDRMIENWILANPEACGPELEGVQWHADGCHGKDTLRSALTHGLSYRETTLGVKLFGRLDPGMLYVRSASFRRFVNRIDFDCAWLRPAFERRDAAGDGV